MNQSTRLSCYRLPRAVAVGAAALALHVSERVRPDSGPLQGQSAPEMKFAPYAEDYRYQNRLRQVEAQFPLDARRARADHARESGSARPGADRPDLRASHRRSHSRRTLRRRNPVFRAA